MAPTHENQPVFRLPVVLQDLPALRYKENDWISQDERQIAIGSISLPALASLWTVDRLNPKNESGYQRQPTESRVNSLKRDLERAIVDLPTAILLNLRQFNPETHLSTDSSFTELVLKEPGSLYVVDGQHRVEALVRLYQEDQGKWGSYQIPFVCLLGADQGGEMTEFHVVNSNAKSIATGLAYELLKRRADNSAIVRDHLTETGKVWVQKAGTLTDKLAQTEIWCGRIQMPERDQRGTLITSNGMTTSLRPLVEQPGFFQSVSDPDQQVKILDAYWGGIKLVLPEAMEDPEKFNIQRSLGVNALHPVLVNVLAIMSSKGRSTLDPKEFAEVMRVPLEELSGPTPDGEVVQGTDFWRRGSEGASGLFNGRAGRRVLQAQITERLPGIEVI